MALLPNICNHCQPEMLPTDQAGGFLSNHVANIVMFRTKDKGEERVNLVNVVFAS